jgi:hypothetical protein
VIGGSTVNTRTQNAGDSTPATENEVVDSSGLSYYDTENEDDTIARIEANPEDSGWFFSKRKRGAPPASLNIPHSKAHHQDPSPSPGMEYNFKSPISALSPRDAAGEGKANVGGCAVPNPDLVPLSPGNRPVAANANQVMADLEGYGEDGKIIPGYIFVTQGHSSAIQTKQTSLGSKKTAAGSRTTATTLEHSKKAASLTGDNEEEGEEKRRQRRFCLCKVGLLFLLAALVVGIAMICIVLKSRLGQDGTTKNTLPNGSMPTFPPVFFTASPSGTPSGTPSVSLTSKVPTGSPSATPIVDQVKDFLISQYPDSASALEDTSSPQYMALEWIVQDLQPIRRTRRQRQLQEATTITDPRLVQRWTLAVIFFATGGRTIESSRWIASEGWLKFANECLWDFVVCNDLGKVQALSIENNKLVGSIPAEIALLGEPLTKLSLFGNQLEGTLPSSIGLLTALSRLNLNGNKLSGSIPSEISSMTSLRYCALSRNSFSGQLPNAVASLTNLSTLDLTMTNLSGTIPSEIAQMSALEFLSFESTGINGTIPTELGDLSMLDQFTVAHTSLTGSIPPGICARASEAQEIKADCDEIDCPCCNVCCFDGSDCIRVTPSPTPMIVSPTLKPTASPISSTPRPTRAATGAPSTAPVVSPVAPSSTPSPAVLNVPHTSLPTFCEAQLSTDKKCYEDGEDITVSFVNCDAQSDDWIGVYAAGQDDWTALSEPIAWLWAAGDQFIQVPVSTGSVTFADARGTGLFQVVIVRNRPNPPFRSYGLSDEFRLSTNCAAATTTNTRSP